MAKSKRTGILIRCIKIVFLVCLILALGYGLLLTIIGTSTKREIENARTKDTAITVQITELRHSSNLSRSIIVVLKPETVSPDTPELLGRTIATTSNEKLSVGDQLTMYYDPQNPQDRVIDFQTAEPTQKAGLILTGAVFAVLLILMSVWLIRRKHHRQPTAIA